jgi:hypothetical protein
MFVTAACDPTVRVFNSCAVLVDSILNASLTSYSCRARRNYFRHCLVSEIGRPRRRWEDNIKMDLREVGCGGADWIDLAQNRDRWRALVYTVMNLRVP